MSDKKRYQVKVTETHLFWGLVEVEACSEEEAQEIAAEEFHDVSRSALRAMADDCYLAESMRGSRTWHGEQSCSVFDFAVNEK